MHKILSNPCTQSVKINNQRLIKYYSNTHLLSNKVYAEPVEVPLAPEKYTQLFQTNLCALSVKNKTVECKNRREILSVIAHENGSTLKVVLVGLLFSYKCKQNIFTAKY
jgi:hypothetical protein